SSLVSRSGMIAFLIYRDRGTDSFEFAFEAAIFLFERGLVSTAWKCIFSMLAQFFAPLMNRGVRNTQLAGDLRDRFAAGLSKPHRFLFELTCVDFLDFCHADPFPSLLEYISALWTLSNRGKITLGFDLHWATRNSSSSLLGRSRFLGPNQSETKPYQIPRLLWLATW